MFEKKYYLIILILGIVGIVKAQPYGYGYGKKVTINASEVVGATPLINYPLMVRFTGASADNDLRSVANGGHVENVNGFDILFTSDAAGSNLLDHQIEYYNATLGEYVAWVRIPSLSNVTNTEIFMFYGNCSVVADPSTTSTWNSDYDAVYFLHNNFVDATGNGNNATNSGTTNTSPGIIGDGQNFVNVVSPGDHIQAPSASISVGQATLSIWLNAASFSANHQYIFGHTTTPPFANRIQLYVNDATGLLDLGLGNSHNTNINFFDLNTAEWYYVALTWNGTNYVVYVNGVAQATGAYAGLGSLNTFLDIGNNGNAATRNETWIGDLDHARFSNEVFSADWIQTEYNNQRPGSTFYSVGNEFSAIRTFYSFATGAWESNTSWSFTTDGSSGVVPPGVFPRRADNVVIQTGHNITINSITDNGSCALSPDGLGRSNVGPFISSNVAMFYQTGDITISGTLTVSGMEMMTGGYTHILPSGAFNLSSYLVNVGYLEADAGSTLSTLDDFVITGNSTTIINTNSTSADDIIIDHTDATLCGTGTATLQNGAGSAISYSNSATVNQVCTSFTINCTGGGCSGFPVTGTGNFATGNIGPGGVGDSNNNSLWLRANAGTSTTTNGAAVSSWSDQSGNANHAVQASANLQPLFQSAVINNQPTILFDNVTGANSDVLTVPDSDNLDNTNGLSILAVTRPLSLDNTPRAILSKRVGFNTNQAYSLFFSAGGNKLNVDIDLGNNRFPSALSFANGTNYITSLLYDGTLAAALRARLFVNGNLDITANEASATIPNYASDLSIGLLNVADGRPFGGHIAEIVIYNRTLNVAQRIITDNYLSAKYDITLTSNDVYVMDNSGNGDFDFNVAGIGQASDGSNHKDAKGSGVVRMWNPGNLANGEFLIWGHNSLNFSGGNTDVDGIVIQERISRVWRVSEVGDVGTVSLSVDLSGTLGSSLGNNLRLLIDRDGDGFADNDVTPVAGSFSGTVITFSGINLQDGDRFTIGNTDLANPLPIQLISFSATAQQAEVKLQWSTASELNNDFFTIQRSQDAENWEDVMEVKGAGDSQVRLDYETIDGLPYTGISYYRLKQTDFDKQYSYSGVRRVEVTQAFQLKVYPNPSSGTFRISTGFEIQSENVRLVNMLGQVIPVSLQPDGTSVVIDSGSISSGVYVVQVSKGYWRQSVRIIIE